MTVAFFSFIIFHLELTIHRLQPTSSLFTRSLYLELIPGCVLFELLNLFHFYLTCFVGVLSGTLLRSGMGASIEGALLDVKLYD